MGKAQKRTFKEQRYNPLGAPVVQGAATTVQSEDDVPALLKKLASADTNDRVWAAASASNLLVSDGQAIRRLLLANNVVSALIERLSDSVPDVVVQVTGALYNIASIDQGAADEICRKNIFAAIQALVPRLAKSIDEIIKQDPSDKSTDGTERKLVFVTADNLISILWVLCETVPSSIRQINDMALMPFLVSFFGVADKLPSSLVQTAGQFLYSLTESTSYARRTLYAQDGAVKTLMGVVVQTNQNSSSISDDDLAIIRILAGGILANIKPVALSSLTKKYKDSLDGIPAEEAKTWDDLSGVLIHVIAQFISFDIHAAAAQASASLKAKVAARANASISDSLEVIGDETTGEEVALGRLSSRMSYVQMALELAANIFTDEGASDEGADVDADGDADAAPEEDGARDTGEMEDDDDDDDADGKGDDDDDDESVGFDQDDMDDLLADEDSTAKSMDQAMQGSILGVFINSIIPSLQRLAEPTTMTTVATALNECLDSVESDSAKMLISAVEDFVALEERALGCFNNFLLVVEDSLKSWFRLHSDSVNSWWSFLIAIAEHIYGKEAAPKEFQQVDQRLRFSVLEPTFGCMWTLARCVSGGVPVTPDQIMGLIRVYEAAPSSEIRVKVVGALGHIARRQPGHVEENQHIGTFLLKQVVSKPLLAFAGSMADDIDVEPIVEALDIMFDIYSDMAFDYDEPVFVRGRFLENLRKLYPPLRKLSKAVDRRKQRELRDRSDLAVQNLRAFVEYKASERQ